ncbi:MAG: glycosyltransferase family 4 protein [Planctomycetota bacterium]
MKVLVVTNMFPVPARPAFGIFIKEQAESLRRQGVEVDVLFIEGYRSKLNYIKAVWELRRRICQNNYDLVHAHYGLSGWVARMQCGLPVAVTFHGDDLLGTPVLTMTQPPRVKYTLSSRVVAGLNKILARLVDAVIVQSAQMRYVSGNPKSMVIPCGIDFNLFQLIDKPAACRQLGLDARKKYILFAADPSVPRKNFPLAQQVFDIVKKYYPEVELLAVFNNPYEKIPLYMNACDILIFTSIVEGAGVVIKEAMACNLPVVSVDVGDVKEVISGADNCYLTTRNPEEMSQKVLGILNNGKRSNGRDRVEQFELSNIAARIISFYHKL